MMRNIWRCILSVVFVLAVLGYGCSEKGEQGTEVSGQADEQGVVGGDQDTVHPASGISSPIELDLTLISTNELEGDDAGGEVVVGVTMTPLIDSENMHWFLKLPEGLSILSGPGSWEGKVEKDTAKTFQLTFSVPDGKRYELYSRAEAHLANGDIVTKGSGFHIDLGPKEEGNYPAFERTDSEGRRIISYKGRSEGGGE